MEKIPKQAYTTEVKELAIKRVMDVAAVAAVVKELGIGDQTLDGHSKFWADRNVCRA